MGTCGLESWVDSGYGRGFEFNNPCPTRTRDAGVTGWVRVWDVTPLSHAHSTTTQRSLHVCFIYSNTNVFCVRRTATATADDGKPAVGAAGGGLEMRHISSPRYVLFFFISYSY